MKGMLMIDEQSHREQKLQAHIHMSPPITATRTNIR